jgi:hypothetical protein
MNTSNLSSEEIFNFPCDYPVKVFGKEHEELHITICSIIEKHTDKLHPNQISIKRSSKGKYVSLTVRIIATSRTQLDSINQELQDCPLVAYVL